MLRLQQHDFKVVYKAGIDNPADFLSRHPLPVNENQRSIAEEYINFITCASVPNAITVNDVSKATEDDKSLRALRAAIRSGCWDTDQLRPYKPIKEELTV